MIGRLHRLATAFGEADAEPFSQIMTEGSSNELHSPVTETIGFGTKRGKLP